MKNAILLCFLFLQFSSSGQTYKVIYEQRESINLPEELIEYKDRTDCEKYNIRVFEYLVNNVYSSYLFTSSYIDNLSCYEAYAGTFPGASETYFMKIDSGKVYKNSYTLLREDEFIEFDLKNEFSIVEKDSQQKILCEHICKGLTVKNSRGSLFKIWYADDIYLPGGPEIFGGFPGLVLSVEYKDGNKVIVAKKVTKTYDAEILIPEIKFVMSNNEFINKMNERFKKPK